MMGTDRNEVQDSYFARVDTQEPEESPKGEQAKKKKGGRL